MNILLQANLEIENARKFTSVILVDDSLYADLS